MKPGFKYSMQKYGENGEILKAVTYALAQVSFIKTQINQPKFQKKQKTHVTGEERR